MKSQQAGTQLLDTPIDDRERIFEAFRRWGYLQANLDPLGQLKPEPQADLDLAGEHAAEARAAYCGTVAAEFMHIASPEKRKCGSSLRWNLTLSLPIASSLVGA
jgi:hypothetical protein